MLKKIFHILILNILLLFLEWVWRSFLITMKLYFESFISHSRLKVCYLHYTYLYMIGSTFPHIFKPMVHLFILYISLLLRDCCKLVQDGSTLDNLERYGRWNLKYWNYLFWQLKIKILIIKRFDLILNLFHEYILSTSLNVCFHHELPFLLIWNRSVLFVWKLYLLGSISSKVYQPSCRIHDKGLLLCSHWIWLSRRKRNDKCEPLVSNQN